MRYLAFLLIMMTIVASAHADFGILAPLGTSQTQFEAFTFFKKCKRQDDALTGYTRFTCTNPDKSIREADFLFFEKGLVGVNASFKMPGEYDLNDADDAHLLDELRGKIKSTISTTPEIKTWADARSSRLHEDTTLDFPMELYSNDRYGAVLKYIRHSSGNYVRVTFAEATFVFRKEARAYMKLVEDAQRTQTHQDGQKLTSARRQPTTSLTKTN